MLGATLSEPMPLPEHGVTVVFIDLPNTRIELLEPLGDGSPVSRYLEKHTGGGMHHICLEVTDIIQARDELQRKGARILGDGEPKIGAHGNPVIFMHPSDFHGTLIELDIMTIFFIFAALLVTLCLLWLLVGLFRNSSGTTDQEAINISLARERGEVLANALADGSIDQETYREERNQLDLDLASDLTLKARTSKSSQTSNVVAAVLVAVFVPITAGSLYLKLGDPGAITRDSQPGQRSGQSATNAAATGSTNAGGAQLPAPLLELLPKLEERLAADPNDIEGWRLLGRSYISVQDYTNAERALKKALALDENDVGTLAQVAESIAMGKGGDLSGEPMDLLQRAVTINPRHEHSLWLRSIGKQQEGDHQEALVGFNILMGLARNNQNALDTIDQMRSRSIQILGASSVRQANNDGQDEAASATETEQTEQTDHL